MVVGCLVRLGWKNKVKDIKVKKLVVGNKECCQVQKKVDVTYSLFFKGNGGKADKEARKKERVWTRSVVWSHTRQTSRRGR